MPLRIALALTLMRMTRPLTTARTFWMFALNLRAVMPVILVPTPPRYLALPRCVIWLPKLVFLPVKWHTRGIRHGPFFSDPRQLGRRSLENRRGDCKSGRHDPIAARQRTRGTRRVRVRTR